MRSSIFVFVSSFIVHSLAFANPNVRGFDGFICNQVVTKTDLKQPTTKALLKSQTSKTSKTAPRLWNVSSHVMKVISGAGKPTHIVIDGANLAVEIKKPDKDSVIGGKVPAGLKAYDLGADTGIADEWGINIFMPEMNPEKTKFEESFTMIVRTGAEETQDIKDVTYSCTMTESGVQSADPVQNLY